MGVGTALRMPPGPQPLRARLCSGRRRQSRLKLQPNTGWSRRQLLLRGRARPEPELGGHRRRPARTAAGPPATGWAHALSDTRRTLLANHVEILTLNIYSVTKYSEKTNKSTKSG